MLCSQKEPLVTKTKSQFLKVSTTLIYLLLFFFAVMALYPQTTCFYKAVINQLPQTAQDEYQVLFEDSSYSEGFSPPLMVAQRYVIDLSIKEKKK